MLLPYRATTAGRARLGAPDVPHHDGAVGGRGGQQVVLLFGPHDVDARVVEVDVLGAVPEVQGLGEAVLAYLVDLED